jgi:predicted nuclease of predicted toxin-antitoxin system
MPSCINRTADNLICSIADRDRRVVFSKDADFLSSHFLHGTPAKLLIVATGNIGNQDLTALPLRVLPKLNRLFETHVLIELNRKALVVRH